MKIALAEKRLPVLVALALLGVTLGVFFAIDRNGGVRLGAPSGGDSLLIGVPGTVTIPIVNRSVWRAVRIEAVTPSCGCLRVEEYDARVGPLGRGRIKLRAETDARFVGVTQSVEVVTSKGEKLRSYLSVEPARPFMGWPTHVVATLDDGTATIVIEAAYLEVVQSIVALDKADGELPVEIDRTAGLAVIQCERDGVFVQPHEVLVTFGPQKSPNWAGPVVTNGGSSRQAGSVP